MKDDEFYERALRRIYRIIVVLGLAGSVVGAWYGGVWWGAGFLAGAAGSFISFHSLHRLAGALGPQSEDPGMARRAWLFGMRYVLIGAAAYGILKYSEIRVEALVAGLLVAVGAVLVEILFELIYART